MTFINWLTGAEDHIWSMAMTPAELMHLCTEPHSVMASHRIRMLEHLVVSFTPVPQADFEMLIDGGTKDRDMSPAFGMLIRELYASAAPGQIYFAYGIAETGFISIVGPPKAPDAEVQIPKPHAGRVDFNVAKPNVGFMHGELPKDARAIGQMIHTAICHPIAWTTMLDGLSLPVYLIASDGSMTRTASIPHYYPHPHRRVVYECKSDIIAGCHNGVLVISGNRVELVDQIFKLWAA